MKDKAPVKEGDLDHQGRRLEMYEGKLLPVLDPRRSGWWRFHEHYDRDGYCDNPARGY